MEERGFVPFAALMNPKKPLHAGLLTLALAVFSPSQEPIRWFTDLQAGLKEAVRADKPVLLVFTVERLCPTCLALEQKVWADQEWASGAGRHFIHVRLVFAGTGGCEKSRRVLAATARLKGYPTIYLLDAKGWPFFVQHGYAGESVNVLAERLDAARKEAGRPSRLRARGDEGCRELLAWYREHDNRMGETLAAAALYDSASGTEQASFAPVLVGAAVARSGIKGAEPHFAVLRRDDPEGRLGFHPSALDAAGSQFLRRDEFADAARCFQRLLALPAAAPSARMEAEMSAAYAYRRLDAPCLARSHYAHAIGIASSLGGDEAARMKSHAQAQIEKISPCGDEPCTCASKRVRD